MSNYKSLSARRLYRSRDGVILGICRGLADYFNLRVGWVRFFTVLISLFSGIWPLVAIYIIAGILMKPEPVLPLESEDQRDFYDNYTDNRHRTLRDLKRRFEALDQRLRRMENKVTSKDFAWEQRFKRNR